MATNEEKLKHLRIVRNAYLKDWDSEVLKYLSMGETVPNNIKTYLQSLRDMPSTYTSMDDAVFPDKPIDVPVPEQ
jgi:hypothetical protein